MIKIITDTSKIDLNDLEQFVYQHPHGNFFQSTKAFYLFQAVDNYDPILIVALNGEEIVGSLLAVVIREGKGQKGYFSRRCIVWGGPLTIGDNPEICAGILSELNRLALRKAIYTEFRNFVGQTHRNGLFTETGYQFNNHLNFIIMLDNKDEVLSRFKSEKRRQVKKALREGVTIKKADNIEQVEKFYNILLNLYRTKVKKPLPSYTFFESFFKKKAGIFLLINFNNTIIGGAMLPVFKNTIYDWFRGGLDQEYKKQYPSTLAVWAGIEYGINKKLEVYDFMGAGKPEEKSGVRIFKSQFGGELVNYGRFMRINKKIHYQVGKLGLKILQKVL